MKVILLQDVKGQGKKGQMVDVSDGYARNFLLPRKLAQEANASNMNTMKLQEKARLEREARERQEAVETAKRLESCVVKIQVRTGAGGRLFGAVTSQEISDALMKQYGIDIGKNKIIQDEPIKQCGSYQLKKRVPPLALISPYISKTGGK
jgi:large subunit ribosomal protein L9